MAVNDAVGCVHIGIGTLTEQRMSRSRRMRQRCTSEEADAVLQYGNKQSRLTASDP